MRSAAAVALFIVLAGCATPAPQPADDVQATTGVVLDGLVVDEAITPLVNATVAIVGTNHSTVSDSDGRFSFTFTQPGALTLTVSKEGYIAQTVDVAMTGDDPLVRVQMARVLIPVPTADVKEWTGIIQCSVRTPQDAYAACKLLDDFVGLVGDDAEKRYEDIDTPPTFVQVEMEWMSTQPLGSSLRLMLTDDHRQGLDNYAVATGTSPLMVKADNGTLQFKHLAEQGLLIRVFTGEFEGLPASLTVQQTFDVYTSVFQDYTPPEAWRFTDGGGLPPP